MSIWVSLIETIKRVSNSSISNKNFNRSIVFVLSHEGGLVDDRDDPGGITNHGISLKYHPKLGREGIKNLTVEQAKEIYRKEYWELSGASMMSWPLCLVVFDSSVNPGIGTTDHFLSQIESYSNPKITAQAIINMRRAYYFSLIEKSPAKKKYLNGWNNRLKDLEQEVSRC